MSFIAFSTKGTGSITLGKDTDVKVLQKKHIKNILTMNNVQIDINMTKLMKK